MTILLVDDERPAIQALVVAINWAELGFDTILTAYDALEAQALLEQGEVSVLLCDIEMPGNSGLELLQWVKAHRPDTVCILFTCHADFDYAQRAVALGAFEYLLKPAAIDIVIQAVTRAGHEYRRRCEQELLEGRWEDSKAAVLERFWLETVLGELPEDKDKLLQVAARRGVKINEHESYMLLVCSVRRTTDAWLSWQAVDLDYAFKNVLTELFTFTQAPVVLSDSTKRKVILLPLQNALQSKDIIDKCTLFFDAAERYFKAEACFYVSGLASLSGLAEEHRQLAKAERQNISYNSKVFFCAEKAEAGLLAQPPEMRSWQQLLQLRDEHALYIKIKEWMTSEVSSGKMNARALELFYHEFLQMLYTVLSQNNISAAQLLRSSEQNAARAMTSIEEMEEHIKSLLNLSCKYLESVSHENAMVEKVKEYIESHLADDISRDMLAKIVYLNPNYLSRLFHRETGVSLVDYITGRRIAQIKLLLRSSDMSVTQAAGQLGYTNMPYFSKVFKKEAGCSPVEYRRQFRGEK